MGILVADHTKVMRLHLKSMLKKEGYEDVRLASTASEVFDALGMEGGAHNPDGIELILMDMLIPEINGIEACRRIKSVEALADIPVIMVTAVEEAASLQSAMEAGAGDYLTKPVNRVELAVRVSTALRLRRETEARKMRELELESTTRQLREANRILKRISFTDGLTGLSNSRFFDDFLAREWKRCMREKKPVSLILVDIDYFKAYQDKCGQETGDECLKKIAGKLAKTVKRSGDMVARRSVEEFAIVLPATLPGNAMKIAEDARAGVEALNIPHPLSNASRHVTISLGVSATVPRRNATPYVLVKAADRALIKAKREGRNRIALEDLTAPDK